MRLRETFTDPQNLAKMGLTVLLSGDNLSVSLLMTGK